MLRNSLPTSLGLVGPQSVSAPPFLARVLIALACGLAAPNSANAQDEPVYPLSAVSVDNKLFVADRLAPGIWEWAAKPTLHAPGGKRFRTPLNAIRCIAADAAGQLLIGDSATREVYRMGADKKPVPLTAGDNPFGRIGIPMSVAVHPDGDIFVADLDIHAIWRIESGGGAAIFARVRAPRGLAFDADNNLLVVCHGDDQVLRLDSDGKSTVVVKGRPFRFPNDLAVGKDGAIYVSDGYAKAIWRIEGAGEPEKWVSGAPLVNPVGLLWNGDHLVVVDPRAKQVFRVAPDGKIQPLAGGQ